MSKSSFPVVCGIKVHKRGMENGRAGREAAGEEEKEQEGKEGGSRREREGAETADIFL